MNKQRCAHVRDVRRSRDNDLRMVGLGKRKKQSHYFTVDSQETTGVLATEQRTETMRKPPGPASSRQDVSLETRKKRMLVHSRSASDRELNANLNEFAKATGQVTGVSGRKCQGWTATAAFNDPDLDGGGFNSLYQKMVVCQAFCPNEKLKNGMVQCAQTIAHDHIGPCPKCKADVHQQLADGSTSMYNVDYYFRLDEYYKVVFGATDIAQRLVDYYPTSIAQLSLPLNDRTNHRVLGTQTGFVARHDFVRNPEKFTMDILPAVGEEAYLCCKDGGDDSDLVSVVIVEEASSHYVVRRQGAQCSEIAAKSKVHKRNGRIQLNVVTAVDAQDVLDEYSDLAKTEQWMNIDEGHRRREEFSPVLGISSGGRKHYNVHERGIFYEKQRRRLCDQGTTVGPFTVWYEGREVTVHSATLFRNEFCCCMDNPEVASSGGVMDHRNSHSLSPFLDNFRAHSLRSSALYCWLLNQNTKPISRAKCEAGFEKAEELRGTRAWKKNARLTGFKSKTISWGGSQRHGLTPRGDQSTYMRVDHEKYHSQGIITRRFREFLLSLLKSRPKRLMADQQLLIRQPPGT